MLSENEPKYVDAREAARLLGVSQRTVRNLARQQRLEIKTEGEGAASPTCPPDGTTGGMPQPTTFLTKVAISSATSSGSSQWTPCPAPGYTTSREPEIAATRASCPLRVRSS